MCGILGLVTSPLPPHPQLLLNCLAHRGPDDEGVYQDAQMFLGARRLSIIDLAAGHQPLSNEDGSLWVAQNGELYNYREVRAELEKYGHQFRTQCDTEVIVHAYEEWGVACPKHLRGIFAFAVWDRPRQRLFLARDRFGVKPLYYRALAPGFAFASEIRPLLPLGQPGPNASALRALFTVGFIPTPHTAFAGIFKLPAAHTLIYENDQIKLEPYWSLDFQPSSPIRLSEVVEGFGAHLQRAVTEQRMSEVPLGALLSGGLDSSSIAALLQTQMNEPLHTFNIAFETAQYDEARHAARVARHLGTTHHQIVFREADFERYPQVLAHLEEPQCSATALPIYLLYEACRQAGLTVILTGEGADELLGGYHWFQGDQRARPLLGLPRSWRSLLAATLPISPAGRAVLRGGERNPRLRYLQWHTVGDTAHLLSPDLAQAEDLFEQWLAAPQISPFRQFQQFEVHGRLVDFINFEVDRMSMAHSIEARVPFLDHELWEFVAAVPETWLTRAPPKTLLRHAMRSHLPATSLSRAKQGLAAPYAAWLRRPCLPEWAEDALSANALKDVGLFNAARVAYLRAEHQAGHFDHGRVLMGVLSTQVWYKQLERMRDKG